MRHRGKLAMLWSTVALALAIAAGTASALRSLSLSPAGEFTLTARALTFEAEGLKFQYNVRFTGTLARTIAKTRGAHAGSITRGTVESCRVIEPAGETCTATATPLTEAWNLDYESFSGTLPNITGVVFAIEQAELLIADALFGVNRRECLYRSRIGVLARVGARGEVNGFGIAAERATLSLFRDLNFSGICPLSKADRGEFAASPAQTVRLI